MTRFFKCAGLLRLGGVLAAAGAWSALALPCWRWRGVGALMVLFAAGLVRFFAVEPSNDRDWQADVVVLGETRKEKGEGYSTVKGFFRQYEIHCVVADERDVIRLRTNYRRDPPEDVYVYRIQGPIENGRKVFLVYMNQINVRAQAADAAPDFSKRIRMEATL